LTENLLYPTYAHLGYLLWQQGRYEEAEAILSEGLETARRALGEDDPVTLHIANNLGIAYKNP